MTAGKKWVTAASSAAVLAGGLFLGAPAAHADTCAPAGTAQTELIAAADTVHDAGVHFNSLVTDPATLTELENAQVALESAILYDDTKGGAEAAWNTVLGLQQSYAQTAGSAEVTAAWEASSAAAADFQAAVLNSGVHMEDGQWLVAMFESSCGPLITGTGAGTGTGTDAGSSTGPASGMNPGWNVQTAEEGQLDSGLLAGLLAAGVAVTGAVAFRLRRSHA